MSTSERSIDPTVSRTVDVKQQVRQFYDQVGWQKVEGGIYENALFEDLRPVSSEYIRRCRLRVLRHIKPSGRFLLDAGSGPVQYPEYVEYSNGYAYRVCVDISVVALQEARKRIGNQGLYVVADVAHLPFKAESFEGVVSLHTIHHLPQQEHLSAFQELYRVLEPGSSAVVVNGWSKSSLAWLLNFPNRVRKFLKFLVRKNGASGRAPKGTHVKKYNASWLKHNLGRLMPIEILVWRSLNRRILHTYFHEGWGGRFWLRILFALEERFPHFFGENGNYAMVVIRKV